VTATATTTVNGGVFGAGLGGGAGAKQIVINDVFIEWAGAGTDEGELANAIAAINAQSGTTGVVASRNITNGQVDITAADGRNIEIAAVGANTGMADLGLSAGTNEGTISYSSTSELGIQFTTQAYTATTDQTAVTEATDATFAKIGQTNQATYDSTAVATGSSGMSGLSVASVTGATAALATVDTALDSINSSRATLGAYQNRFESVVANLQTTSENLSASRSRIVDADFASETANLTKAQILQQSGIAMLAQANALPQNVLALLQ
jgi:flagellin